jgi:hypothetical protein
MRTRASIRRETRSVDHSLHARRRVLTASRRHVLVLLIASVMVGSGLPTSGFAQSSAPGGFIEPATSTQVRAPVKPTLPARGPFTFPAPYGTTGVRITNASDCTGGTDCLDYVGYSYWRNMNSHVGSDSILIFLTLDRNRGGGGPTLFSYNKLTDEITKVGPLFDSANPLSWATGEGWYWSGKQASTLYVVSGAALYRYDVNTKQLDRVFDATAQFGSNRAIWQTHSSDDDAVHSATLRDSTTWEMLGCLVYSESTKQFSYFPKTGAFDECQVDKSGRWLLIKEQVDGAYGEDNVIVNLQTGVQTRFLDQAGAAGHSDNGYGYMVAADNWNALPGAVRVWRFDQPFPATEPGPPPQGVLVYRTTDWSADIGHLSHANAQPGVALDQQYVCGGNASRNRLPRNNEVLCFRLDGSLQVLIVAPVMTNLDATGGGNDYAKLPKGNLDVTGQYFIWTSNAGTSRLDAFLVKVPVQVLGVSPGGGGGDTTAPTVSITAPGAGSTVSGSVTVSASATDNVGVAGVQFKLDGTNLGPELTAAPFSMSWNTTTSGDGTHSLVAVARDVAGNRMTSAAVLVTISNDNPAGSPVGVVWTNVVNATADGSSLRKTGGCDGCDDAGATSQQQITSGDGYLTFTVSDPAPVRFVGLGQGSPSTNAGIMFAIRLQAGVAEVRESGRYRADTRVAAGDVFSVVIESGVVKYYKNTAVFYTSATTPTYPLTAVARLLNSSSTVTSAMISGGPSPDVHLALDVNKQSFRAGESIRIALTEANSGSPTVVDAYFGILLPPAAGPMVGCTGGDAVALFTDSFTRTIFTCLSSPAAFRPLWPNMLIPAAAPETNDPNFFGFVWPANIPEGTYTIFMAFLRRGALASANVDKGTFTAVAATSVTFGP